MYAVLTLCSEEHKPSKNELKKRAKEAEKEKKKAERAAKLAEEEKARQAAIQVRLRRCRLGLHHSDSKRPS